ncbi:MAG: helix-turn-helix transcriptional regulator [Lachnospiraceae bacterium]|nr:helix-turn-helix transcriptional regulator [Lachnospiraceae bacterium]
MTEQECTQFESFISSTQFQEQFALENWHLEDHMPGLYYGGRFHPASTWQMHVNGLPCFLLIFVFSGSGTLSHPDGTFFLQERNLLLLEHDIPFQVRIAPGGMDCALFFLRSGEVLPYYHAIGQKMLPPLSFPTASDMEYYVTQLLELLPVRSTASAVAASKWIVSILSEICAFTLSDDRARKDIPDYISEMKHTFDTSYQAAFRLEDFEMRYSIHRDRLCREFSRCYGMPPLQYLNARRIEAAKDLLITTNMRVYEVGNAVGIENTNHFINLFKKRTGLTPMRFKKSAPAAVCELHSPHKPAVRQP